MAASAAYRPWRQPELEYRDTGIGKATAGLAGARVVRPAAGASGGGAEVRLRHPNAELCLLVVLSGSLTLHHDTQQSALKDGDSVAVPSTMQYCLSGLSPDCEVLDVTLPAFPETVAS